MKVKFFLPALLLLLACIPANAIAASITELSLQYSERFIEDSPFQASFKCSGGDYTGAEINISKGTWWYSPSSFTETPLGDNITLIQYNIDPKGLDGTGTYLFKGTCLGDPVSAASVNFDIYDYELEIISPSSTLEVSQGDYVTTVFTFKKVLGTSKYDVSDAKFNVILSRDNQELVIASNTKPNMVSGNLEIKSIISYVPSEKFYGLNDLIVEYTAKNSVRDAVNDVINLNRAFEMSFEDPAAIQMSSGGSINIPIFISSPKISSGELNVLEFDVSIDGYHESISGLDITCSISGTGLYRCVLPISVPDKPAGSYALEIEGSYLSYYDSISKEIYFTIPFTGTLTYASGQIVDAHIEMLNMETGKWYTASVNKGNGQYSLSLLPGTYTLKLSCPEIQKIEIRGVEIKEGCEMVSSNSPMSVDSFVGGSSIPGIDSVKLVVFQFALPFDDSDIWIKYNDVDVPGSEEDMELYSCHDWNYGKRKCNGEWKSLDFDINMVTNMIQFNVTEFSAFILGNKKEMSIEVTMDQDTYNSNEYITFTGNVIDNNANPVENAKITYKIKDTSLSGESYTDNRGHFLAADMRAPEPEGTYLMEITVQKSPFKSFTTTYPIKIKKKVEFTVVVPEEVKVNLDESRQITISVINTGQIDLQSISLSARGISTEWYNMVPMTINNLTAGTEKTVTMNFRVPSEYCIEKCQIYHFVDIIAKSDSGLEQMKSFTFQISENVTEQVSTGFSLPSLPTGNVVESVSNPYVAVGIFIVIAFFFLFFMKRRNRTPGYKSYGKKTFSGGKDSLMGGALTPPTFFKKGYQKNSFKSNFRSNYRNTPRESVVPTLYEIKKSTREWGQ